MVLLLGTLVALHLPREMRPTLAFCGGAMLLVTAFISYRLNVQEAAYARLLSRMEQDQPNWLPSPDIGGGSSRRMMPIMLAFAGVAMAASGIWF